MGTSFHQRLKKYLKIMSVMSALSESCSYESLMCHLKGEYFFLKNTVSSAIPSALQRTLASFSSRCWLSANNFFTASFLATAGGFGHSSQSSQLKTYSKHQMWLCVYSCENHIGYSTHAYQKT